MSRWFTQLRSTLRSLSRRNRVEQELDEELQYHLERQVKEELNKGLPPEEAQYAARRAMGAIAKSKEECRDVYRVNFIEDVVQDLRYAGRTLRRSPGFAVLAVLIMALGIGANAAVFSVVNAVLLNPLSYTDPDRIVTLADIEAGSPPTAIGGQVSIPNFQDWHDQSSSFEAMAYYASRGDTPVMPGSTAEYGRATQVSPEFFHVFGIEPILGRLPSPEEEEPGSGVVVLISYAYWQSRLGGTLAFWSDRFVCMAIRSPWWE